jgi:hypothetical protein
MIAASVSPMLPTNNVSDKNLRSRLLNLTGFFSNLGAVGTGRPAAAGAEAVDIIWVDCRDKGPDQGNRVLLRRRETGGEAEREMEQLRCEKFEKGKKVRRVQRGRAVGFMQRGVISWSELALSSCVVVS